MFNAPNHRLLLELMQILGRRQNAMLQLAALKEF